MLEFLITARNMLLQIAGMKQTGVLENLSVYISPLPGRATAPSLTLPNVPDGSFAAVLPVALSQGFLVMVQGATSGLSFSAQATVP